MVTNPVDPPGTHGTGGADDTAAEFWEQHYRVHGPAGPQRANPLLVEVATGLAPGAALDLACGEGGDAVWLAEHGWQVTAVDLSATAVARLATTVESLGLSDQITAAQHDLSRGLPPGVFDLVNAQYFHTPLQLTRDGILGAAAHALVPGGRLLIVDHGSIAPWSWNQDPQTYFPTPYELAAGLELDQDEWHLERADTPRRRAHGPHVEPADVIDTVVLLRRRGG